MATTKSKNTTSRKMQSKDMAQSIVNLATKVTNKAISEAGYDKTITALIQTCVDKGRGQYKIKYQNSFFTAFAQDTSKVYSNNAVVYVLIPGNDMSNRMFITGLATDNSNQEKSIDLLEPDQQFTNRSSNLASIKNNVDINMSSYWCTKEYPFNRYLYRFKDNESNYLDIDNDVFINYINQLDSPYIRLGCSFKTNLPDERKEGQYGIRLTLKYKDDTYKTYELSTLYMMGSPYNFTSFSPQYAIWEIDKTNLKRIESIEEFMTDFPDFDVLDPEPDDYPLDIFLKDITLSTCQRIYNVEDGNTIVADILMPNGNVFGNVNTSVNPPSTYTKLSFEGVLKIKGNPINGDDIKVYWGKQDARVDSASHSKYHPALGEGWYCLNTATRTKGSDIDAVDIGVDEFEKQGRFKWVSMKKITISQDLFPGKEGLLKCVIQYQNSYYPREIKIINKNGLYVLLTAKDNKTILYNGVGTTSLVAGVFEDDTEKNAPIPHIWSGQRVIKGVLTPYTISYSWSKVDALNPENKVKLPLTASTSYLESPLDNDGNIWNSEYDNETLTDDQVEANLAQHFSEYNISFAEMCIERYNYYVKKYDVLLNTSHADIVQKKRCQTRIKSIQDLNKEYVQSLYQDNEINSHGYYILGPSTFTGLYNDSATDVTDYRNYYTYASIDNKTIQFQFDDSDKNIKHNTVYQVKGATIIDYTEFYVTAFIHYNDPETHLPIDSALETKSLKIVNSIGSNLKYNLQILNGQKNFLYDESGSLSTGTETQSLSFMLYNQQGDLLFDSLIQNEDNNEINLTTLAPKWKFPYKNTHIETQYRPNADTGADISNINCYQDGNLYVLQNQPSFTYTVRDKFCNTYVNNNIELEVIYDDIVITASTNFSFVKQGDMGTNGTDFNIIINDAYYNSHKDYLNKDKLCNFENDGSMQYISAESRFLDHVYLFGTKIYDTNKQEISSFKFSGDSNVQPVFTNLSFAGNQIQTGSSKIGLDFRNTAMLAGNAYEDGEIKNDEATYTWALAKGLYQNDDNSKYHFFTSFKLGTNDSLKNYRQPIIIDYDGDRQDVDHLLLPSPNPLPINEEPETTQKITVANNFIECTAEIPQKFINPLDDTYTQNRTITSFYGIPFFYFAVYNKVNETFVNITPQYTDPAQHIIITGGYNTVMYDETGGNPVYNKQNPFKFYLFNENGKDITDEIITSDNKKIEWSCSRGFHKEVTEKSIKNFNDIVDSMTAKDDYFGRYCKYNNKYYVCNKSHCKDKSYTIDGKVYNAGSFVTPYWKEVNQDNIMPYRCCNLIPSSVYSSNIYDSEFNNWICLTLEYTKDIGSNKRKYLAQAFIPINVLCNPYGSSILNKWDGKHTEISTDSDTFGYMLTNSVVAGHKTEGNSTFGINIGDWFFEDGEIGENTAVSGIFGMGEEDSQHRTRQTLFINADNGKAVFGSNGSNQIVLDPTLEDPNSNEPIWSRLNGWYFSKDFFYKPNVQETEDVFKEMRKKNGHIKPSSEAANGGGFYIPMNRTPGPEEVFLWGGSNLNNRNEAPFKVSYAGTLYATDADITGKVKAEEGEIGEVLQFDALGIHSKSRFKAFDLDTSGTLVLNGELKVTKPDSRFGFDSRLDDPNTGGDKAGTVIDLCREESARYIWFNHKWHPWILPSKTTYTQGWELQFDTSSQSNKVDYTVFHPNFTIRDRGGSAGTELVLNGSIYTKDAMLGNWVVDETSIRNQPSTVILKMPTDPQDEGGSPYFQIKDPHGQLYTLIRIDGNGRIHGEKDGVTTWSISPDGTASFSNNGDSSFTGEYFQTGNGQNILNNNGLNVQNGSITLGASVLTDLGVGQTLKLNNNFSVAGDSVTITSNKISVGDDISLTNSYLRIGSTDPSFGATLQYDPQYDEVTLNVDRIYCGINQGIGRTFGFQGNVVSAGTTIDGRSWLDWMQNLLASLGVLVGVDTNVEYADCVAYPPGSSDPYNTVVDTITVRGIPYTYSEQ